MLVSHCPEAASREKSSIIWGSAVVRAVESMEQTTTVVTITVKMSVLFLLASCRIMVPPMGLLVSYLLIFCYNEVSEKSLLEQVKV